MIKFIFMLAICCVGLSLTPWFWWPIIGWVSVYLDLKIHLQGQFNGAAFWMGVFGPLYIIVFLPFWIFGD